jgi:hypothetical protein
LAPKALQLHKFSPITVLASIFRVHADLVFCVQVVAARQVMTDDRGLYEMLGSRAHPMTEHKPHIRPHRPVVSTVPAGCLVNLGVIVLIIVAGVILTMGIVAPGYRDTPTYQEAMRLVQENPAARQALGEPIKEAALVSFITEAGDDAALKIDADAVRRISLRVSGPQGQATLFAQGQERDGEVTMRAAVLTLRDGRTIELRENR